MLISHGADIEHVDSHGQTALALASAAENMPMVEMLIDQGADVNLIQIQERTILKQHVVDRLEKEERLMIDSGFQWLACKVFILVFFISLVVQNYNKVLWFYIEVSEAKLSENEVI